MTRVRLVAAAALLLAVGAVAGALGRGLVRSPAPASAAAVSPAVTAGAADAHVIDMTKATGVACGPPLKPGKAHPDWVLSQIFTVHDGGGNAYLLGWQILPYQGARTYSFGAAGNVLALQPPGGGRPLGIGTGSVTFGGTGESGTVRAVVRLTAGGSISVTGSWACTVPAPAPPVPSATGHK